MFQSLGGSFSPLPLRVFNLFIFILIISRSNLGPQIIQSSYFCTILPHHLQIPFFLMQRAAISGCRSDVLMLVEDEVPSYESIDLNWSM